MHTAAHLWQVCRTPLKLLELLPLGSARHTLKMWTLRFAI